MPFEFVERLSVFDGANESPLSEAGAWILINSAASGDLQRTGNQAAGTAANIGYRAWSREDFNADQSAYVTVGTKPGTGQAIWVILRIKDVGGSNTWDGYIMELTVQAGADTWAIYSVTNGTASLVNSTTRELVAGERVGFQAIGNALSAWVFTAGAWVQVLAVTDSTNRYVGAVGFGISNTTARVDDMWAGEALPSVGQSVTNVVGRGNAW